MAEVQDSKMLPGVRGLSEKLKQSHEDAEDQKARSERVALANNTLSDFSERTGLPRGKYDRVSALSWVDDEKSLGGGHWKAHIETSLGVVEFKLQEEWKSKEDFKELVEVSYKQKPGNAESANIGIKEVKVERITTEKGVVNSVTTVTIDEADFEGSITLDNLNTDPVIEQFATQPRSKIWLENLKARFSHRIPSSKTWASGTTKSVVLDLSKNVHNDSWRMGTAVLKSLVTNTGLTPISHDEAETLNILNEAGLINPEQKFRHELIKKFEDILSKDQSLRHHIKEFRFARTAKIISEICEDLELNDDERDEVLGQTEGPHTTWTYEYLASESIAEAKLVSGLSEKDFPATDVVGFTRELSTNDMKISICAESKKDGTEVSFVSLNILSRRINTNIEKITFIDVKNSAGQFRIVEVRERGRSKQRLIFSKDGFEGTKIDDQYGAPESDARALLKDLNYENCGGVMTAVMGEFYHTQPR